MISRAHVVKRARVSFCKDLACSALQEGLGLRSTTLQAAHNVACYLRRLHHLSYVICRSCYEPAISLFHLSRHDCQRRTHFFLQAAQNEGCSIRQQNWYLSAVHSVEARRLVAAAPLKPMPQVCEQADTFRNMKPQGTDHSLTMVPISVAHASDTLPTPVPVPMPMRGHAMHNVKA